MKAVDKPLKIKMSQLFILQQVPMPCGGRANFDPVAIWTF
jgi:hypothetical protein